MKWQPRDAPSEPSSPPSMAAVPAAAFISSVTLDFNSIHGEVSVAVETYFNQGIQENGDLLVTFFDGSGVAIGANTANAETGVDFGCLKRNLQVAQVTLSNFGAVAVTDPDFTTYYDVKSFTTDGTLLLHGAFQWEGIEAVRAIQASVGNTYSLTGGPGNSVDDFTWAPTTVVPVPNLTVQC